MRFFYVYYIIFVPYLLSFGTEFCSGYACAICRRITAMSSAVTVSKTDIIILSLKPFLIIESEKMRKREAEFRFSYVHYFAVSEVVRSRRG